MALFREISMIVNYCIVSGTYILMIIKMPVIWKYSEDARKIVENMYKFCVEEKQSGLKMS